MFKSKLVYNYVMFKKEDDDDALRQYADRLANVYNLRCIYVSVNETHWRMTCEGTARAWKEFTSNKATKFVAYKNDDSNDVFTYDMIRF